MALEKPEKKQHGRYEQVPYTSETDGEKLKEYLGQTVVLKFL